MKDLRLFLPLFLLLVVFLFLFAGCKGIVPSPGATDDLTITGQIKMPFTCCTIDEPIYEEATGHYTDSWSIIPGARIELKDAQTCETIDTTVSDETGYYEFDDVEPGLYIITAECPVKQNYLLKDVAEKVAGVPLDAGIPDCDSTALALVIEIANDCFVNSLCFKKNSQIYNLAEDIGEDVIEEFGELLIPEVIDHEDFGNFVDEESDDLVDLVCNQLLGCCLGAGATPPTNPCEGNIAPSLTMPDNVSIDPNPNDPYTWDVSASDPNNDSLEFRLVSVIPTPSNAFSVNATSGEVSWNPDCDDIVDGDTTYTITVEVDDGCTTVQGSFEVTLLSELCNVIANVDDACYQLGCQTEMQVNLYGSASGGKPPYLYEWDFESDGTYDFTGENPTHNYSAGIYNITLTVTDDIGNNDTDTAVIIVHNPCDLPEKLTASSISEIGTTHYIRVNFNNSSGDISALMDYYGWCADGTLSPLPVNEELYVYCTLDASLGLADYWSKLNWIINNRSGYSWKVVQEVVWHYIQGFTINGDALDLFNEAELHSDFCPSIGEKFIVLLTPQPIDAEIYNGNYLARASTSQPILIEVERVNHCE